MSLKTIHRVIRRMSSGLFGGQQTSHTVEVTTGELIPVDGEIVEGNALVDESAIVGVSSPALLSTDPGRNKVLAGTLIVEGYLKIKYDIRAKNT